MGFQLADTLLKNTVITVCFSYIRNSFNKNRRREVLEVAVAGSILNHHLMVEAKFNGTKTDI